MIEDTMQWKLENAKLQIHYAIIALLYAIVRRLDPPRIDTREIARAVQLHQHQEYARERAQRQ